MQKGIEIRLLSKGQDCKSYIRLQKEVSPFRRMFDDKDFCDKSWEDMFAEDRVTYAIMQPRTSTVFAVPTGQAVYELTKEKQREANISAIGKGLSAQTIAIISKMREVDANQNRRIDSS